MWRRSSRVFASAARSTADPTRRRLAYRQWRDFGASKAVVNADGGRGLPKERDNPESQTVQGAEAMKITRVGMYINLGMATTKGVLGAAIQSNALIADAAHSLSDLLSDVVTLWSVRIARLPADPQHPYGYGKFEAVGSLSVGAILVLAGVGIGADSVQNLQELWTGASAGLPELMFSMFPQLDTKTQWALAAGTAGVSIAAKEWLYHATVKVGKQANSKVLIANAWHHRTDAISSVVALGGIMGSMAGVPLLDPLAGIAVSAMIVKTGIDIGLDSVRELTDNTVEAEVLETLKEVSCNVDDVVHVSQVRARRMGPYTLVDLRVHLDSRTSISMAKQVSERVRTQILERVPDVSEVLVGIDVQFESKRRVASENTEREMRPYREIREDVCRALANIPEIVGTTHINAHWLPYLNGNSTVVDVAILVHPDLKVGEAHAVAKRARKAIEAIPFIAEADIHLELQDDA